MKKFTIGTDVEFFLRKNGKYISAIPYIGDENVGTKYNPIKFPNGATLQRDNVLVEFATRPADGKEDFIDSIRDAMLNMFSMLPKNVNVVAMPSVLMPQNELTHLEALEFGCDPDFNAWKNGEVNVKPFAGNGRLRTAGAHIHVGHRSLLPIKNKLAFIRVMDAVCGVASVIMDASVAAKRRKQLYGKAGAHRPTPYGVEYRVLSNFWVRSPALARIMYDYVDHCFTVKNEINVEDIINENKIYSAIKLCKKVKITPVVFNRLGTLKREWRIN